MEFKTENRAMLIMKKGKRETMKRMQQPNQVSNWTLGEKISGNNRHHQINTYVRKFMKRVPQKNKKTCWNQTQQQEPHGVNIYLTSTPRKILRTLLKIDKRETQTKRPKYKEINDNAQGLTPEKGQRLFVKKKKEEDSPAMRITWMQQFRGLKNIQKRIRNY